MNKFTRSQMGKIMAYALSAAMAVTVVPTYMMKPLTVMAATETDEDNYTQGSAIEVTDATSLTEDTEYEIAFFKNKDNIKRKDAVTIVSAKADASNKVTVYVPYSLSEGSYYVGYAAKPVAPTTATAEDPFTIQDKLVRITASSAATGIEISGSNDTIYFDKDTPTKVNTETLTTDLKGNENGKKFESVTYTFTSTKADGTKADLFTVTPVVASGQALTFAAGVATEKYSNSAPIPSFTVTAKNGSTATDLEGATLSVHVEMKVTGRNTTYKRDYEFTAKSGLKEVTDITLTSDKEYLAVGDTATVTTKIANPDMNEKVEYSFAKDATDSAKLNVPVAGKTWNSGSTGDYYLSEAVVGTVHYLFASTDDQDTKYDADEDTLYATFDEATGEVVAKIDGEYTIQAEGVVSQKKGSVAVKALSIKLPTFGTYVDEKTAVTAQKLSVDFGTTAISNCYVEYSTEDEAVAKVVNGLTSYNADYSVLAGQAGVTKVNAKVTVYGTGVTYNFEKDGYIVVAPAKTDKDFEITSVENTEAYINGLADANIFSDTLKEQSAEAIIDNKINAKALTYKAYSLINAKAVNKYSSHYDFVNNSTDPTSGTTAVGLLFAALDKDVISVQDPEDYVRVEYKVSALNGAEEEAYKQKDSVKDFVAEMIVDGKVSELKQPVWIEVNDSSAIKDKHIYTVYDNGEAIYTAKASGSKLTFQTDSFSVFSIVETPDAELTDNTVNIDDNKDNDDIYDLVNFSAHVQRRIGTDDEADIAATVSDDGIISLGTHGQSRRVEKITLTGLDADEVEMTAHVQKRVDHPEDVADLTQVVNEDGSISIGTEHQSRRIEAFSMNLKGDLAEKYDVYYRVHAQNYGWLGWAKNGEIAGTSGHSFRLEGIEIIFVEKGTEFDESQYVKTPEEGDRGYSEKAAYMDRVVSEK